MRTLTAFLLLVLVAAPGFAEDEPPLPPAPEPFPETVPDAPEIVPDDVPFPPEQEPDVPVEPAPSGETWRETPPIEQARRQPAPTVAVEFDTPDGGTEEAPSTKTTIVDITKVHDQPWVRDLLALRLDIQFEVEHCKDQELQVSAWFAYRTRGSLIKSVKKPFRDASGYLSAQTAPVTVKAMHARYETSLWVPYGAFPVPTRGDRYPVEARIKLFRKTDDGSEVVAEKTTTFTVYGPGAPRDPDPEPEPEPEPKPEGAGSETGDAGKAGKAGAGPTG